MRSSELMNVFSRVVSEYVVNTKKIFVLTQFVNEQCRFGNVFKQDERSCLSLLDGQL
jgi:hypothetical protein